MEALTDTIRLGRHRLGFSVINVIGRQIQLIVMLVNTATGKPNSVALFQAKL